jgi:phosphatidate cytidylyltransferase
MLKERIITAALLAAALLTVLFFASADVGVVLFGLLLLVGGWEWAGLARARRPVYRAVFVLFVALLIGWLAWWTPTGRMPAELLWVQLGIWALAAGLLARFPLRLPPRMVALVGLILLPLAWLAFAHLLKTRAFGASWVLYLFLVVAAADVGAYFFGRRFGRTKLAPRVSPGKTREGLFGGLALVACVGIGGAFWFDVSLPGLLALALVVAGVSVIGDLGISMLKRSAGLKDSGQLFPGHGGVLDRIDSLLAAIPVYVLGLHWLVAP